MAYLYSTSKTWRRIVDAANRSKGTMLVFAAACVGVPYFLGDQAGAGPAEGRQAVCRLASTTCALLLGGLCPLHQTRCSPPVASSGWTSGLAAGLMVEQ